MKKMFKTTAAFLFASCLFAAGCSAAPSASISSGMSELDKETSEAVSQIDEERVTFTDDLGQEITMKRPKRTAALIGSFADEWIEAGGEDSLVAAAHDTFTSFDSANPDEVADLGEVKAINVEQLIASEPDFVIASAKNESQKDLKNQLDQAGIPVAYFDVSDFDDYLRTMKIFTDLTGDEEAYAKYGISQQEAIDEAIAQRADADPLRVLYIRATGSSIKSKNSKGSVLGEMLEDLHTENIADSDESILEDLSAEAILKEDPDAIFIVYQGSDDTKARQNLDSSLMSKEAWNELSAVKNGQVYVMDQKLYNLKPNSEWAKAYQDLADLLDQAKRHE